MKVVRWSRPWPILLFTLILVGLACWNLGTALADLEAQADSLSSYLGGVAWDDDRTIIASSALFTIQLIPVVWIYFFASEIARSIVLAFAILRLFWELLVALWFATLESIFALDAVLLFSAAMLLLTSSARDWFELSKEEENAATH